MDGVTTVTDGGVPPDEQQEPACPVAGEITESELRLLDGNR